MLVLQESSFLYLLQYEVNHDASERFGMFLSFGGGVNSVALMILLLREGLPLDEAVFADTGGEGSGDVRLPFHSWGPYLGDPTVCLSRFCQEGRSNSL